MNYLGLSKEVSYVLRHVPSEYGLELDSEGWVEIEELLIGLRKKEKWSSIRSSDLVKMIDVSEKKRHEIKDSKIRALYGHSTNTKIIKSKAEPPKYLFHGTARRFIDSIKINGLKPKERQYVHLSLDKETAYEVGSRRDDKPVILRVEAQKAYRDGISFYVGHENIWLSDIIPSKYIELEK